VNEPGARRRLRDRLVGLLLRAVPGEVRADCRRRAQEAHDRPAVWRSGAVLIGLTWLLALAFVGRGLYAWLA